MGAGRRWGRAQAAGLQRPGGAAMTLALSSSSQVGGGRLGVLACPDGLLRSGGGWLARELVVAALVHLSLPPFVCGGRPLVGLLLRCPLHVSPGLRPAVRQSVHHPFEPRNPDIYVGDECGLSILQAPDALAYLFTELVGRRLHLGRTGSGLLAVFGRPAETLAEKMRRIQDQRDDAEPGEART
jgi:hypothetical protein